MSGAGSSRWVKTQRGGHAAPDYPADVASLLRQLGLSYELEARDTVTLAYVSLSRQTLDDFLATRNDNRAAGRSFGYPATAVEAFAAGESMAARDQQAAEQRLKVPVFTTFRLSQAHAPEELKVMRQWWLLLERYDMVISR